MAGKGYYLVNTIKAIETVYNGYKFRSRIEARWAVFFDTLGIPYEYEAEGFDLEGTWYLPDFRLPSQNCWIEIKGQNPTEQELQKAYKLSMLDKKTVAIFGGECWHETRAYVFSFIEDMDAQPFLAYKQSALREREHRYLMSESDRPYGIWLSDVEYRGFTEECPGDNFLYHIRYGFNLRDKVSWFYPGHWVECPKCRRLWMPTEIDAICKCLGFLYNIKENTKTSRLMTAYTAARQARFEHRGGTL